MDLSYENLLNTLSVANGSQRSSDQQSAEAQLKAWEIEKGFHYLLQQIYLKEDLPLQIRWLAIICFKNGVEKYWRPLRANSISKEEKVQIKAKLFDMINEKNNQLTIQNAHSIARIVRFDFPVEWPTIFDQISSMLEVCVFTKNDLVSANNLLIILNQIIKTVAIVRIGRSRQALQTKAPVITPVLVKLYLKFFHQWTVVNLDFAVMEICYLCLKNLRRIIPEGYEQPHKNSEVIEFLSTSIQHLKMLIVEHEKYSSSDMIERYVRCYSKLYVNLINANPTSFILLPNSQEILSTFMTMLDERAKEIYESSGDDESKSSGERGSFWDTLALKGFLILKRVIGYVYKKGAVTLKERNEKEEIQLAIRKLTTTYFTPDVIKHLCDLIINWYLRLKPSDLESWLIEPEEWCNEEISSSWEFQIRPCAENFFQDLITFFKPELSDFILTKISNGLTQNTSVGDILTKDSIMCTFQLSAISIADNVNFDQILTEILIPEATKNDLSENRIIKRRVCLIINEWISIACKEKASRVEIYKLLINLLQPENKLNDSVVKLTAIQTLKTVIDDWDFNKYDFQPFLNEFIKLCITFLSTLEYTESKLYIINILALMLQRCNPLVDPQTLRDILSIIPNYWESVQSENELILKNSLLRVLKNLVISLNEHSTETFSISIPLIKNCCAVISERDREVYSLLSEDGYELWLSILQYFPINFLSEQLESIIELFQYVNFGLVNSTEILPIIISLVRSYALIAPQLFNGNEAVAGEIFTTLAGYLQTMRDDSFVVFISLMDILLLEKSLDEQFIELLVTSGLFKSMIEYIQNDEHHVVNSNKIFLILSRFNPDTLLYLLTHLSIDYPLIVNNWLGNLNNVGNPRNKKINLLALLSLCERAVEKRQTSESIPILVQKFPEVIKKTFLFLEEVNETNEGNCNVYGQDLIYEDIDDYCYADHDISAHGEKKRYQNLLDIRDPVNKTNLSQFVVEIMKKLRSGLTESEFNQLISMNDEYSIEKLQHLIN